MFTYQTRNRAAHPGEENRRFGRKSETLREARR